MWHKIESKTSVVVLEFTCNASEIHWGKNGERGWGKVSDDEEFPACGTALTIGIALCSTAWVQKIKAASEQYIETEKKKREKAYQGTKFLFPSHLCQKLEQGQFWRMPQCLCGNSQIPRSAASFSGYGQSIYFWLVVPSSLTEDLRNRTPDGARD